MNIDKIMTLISESRNHTVESTEAVEFSKISKAIRTSRKNDVSDNQMGKVIKKTRASLGEDNSGEDTVELTVPAIIRALEWAREDAKSDEELHEFVQRMISKDSLIGMDFFSADK